MNTDVTKRAIPNLKGKLTRVPSVDTTLTREGYAADARAVGEKFADQSRRIDEIDPHFSENVIYDNENSNFESADVQGAIDEISSRLTPTEVKTKNSSVRNDGVGEVLLSITDRNNGTHERYISVSDKTKKEYFADSLKYVEKSGDTYTVKTLFGEHNKPSGSYTGNGSATTRTIDVGGVGGWLGVCSGSYIIGIITQNGAMFFNTTNSAVKCFPVAQAKYMSGVLTISSADDLLNKNGSTYHYQVL